MTDNHILNARGHPKEKMLTVSIWSAGATENLVTAEATENLVTAEATEDLVTTEATEETRLVWRPQTVRGTCEGFRDQKVSWFTLMTRLIPFAYGFSALFRPQFVRSLDVDPLRILKCWLEVG